MADLNRDDNIPKAGPKWWIERVGKAQECLFTVFSKTVWGVWTHWCLYGSQPCYGCTAKCDGCKQRLPKRWKGYLHCYDHHNKRQCFLEITPIVAESIRDQIGEGQPWRGFRLKMKRGNGPKARIKVEVLAALPSGPQLVDERCPEETLLKLWQMNTGEAGDVLEE